MCQRKLRDDDITPELSLREILLLQRQRLEQSKQNFFLSSSPSSYAPSPVPATTAVEETTITLAQAADVIERNADKRKLDDDGVSKHKIEAEDGMELDDSALQLTQTTSCSSSRNIKAQSNKNLTKSPSTSSSLHLFYTNIVRKIPYHGRRKHLSSNTDDDDEDVGVCDVSAGDISDDYDHCDVAIKKKDSGVGMKSSEEDKRPGEGGGLSSAAGTGSDCDVEGESVPREGFYETSDTGGELTTTDDIDSSMNLISNLSYNSSNSNTSIENRSSIDRNKNAHNLKMSTGLAMSAKRSGISGDGGSGAVVGDSQKPLTDNTALGVHGGSSSIGAVGGAKTKLTQKTGAIPKGTKPILCPLKTHSAGAGSFSSPNSSDSASPVPAPDSKKNLKSKLGQLSPVGRSKSFQEPGVKSRSPSPRHKKYARFFQRRRSKRSHNGKGEAKNVHSHYSLDTMYQNIEITIQDEDGNYQPYDDNYDTYSGRRPRPRDDLDDADDYEEDEDDKEVLKEYSQILDSRLKPYRHTMYGGGSSGVGAGGGGGLSDDAGGDISDATSSRSRRSRASDSEHVFGKIMKRMRRISLGWRKPRYHKRRGDYKFHIM